MGMLFVNMGEGDEKEKKSILLGAHRDGSISLLKATGILFFVTSMYPTLIMIQTYLIEEKRNICHW